MKYLVILFTFFSLNAFGQHDHTKPTVQSDTLKKSVPKEAHVQMGDTHMMIHYHAPAVRGRIIWGGLIPYDDVWVTGAHSATNWEFNNDIIIDGQTITAGKYAVFTIPGKDNWIVILNKNWNQHLADDYDAKEDVLRLNVKPELQNHQERLSYAVITTDTKNGQLIIAWEKLSIKVPFQIK